MNLTWEEVKVSLKSLKQFITQNNLWYGIGNYFEYSEDIFNELKENGNNIYENS